MASCGLLGPWCVRVSAPHQTAEEHTFSQAFALVGRHEANSLPLHDGRVCPRHAYLQALPGGLCCVDLGCRTGTHWNGEHRSHGWISPGEQVQIGPFTLELLPASRTMWRFSPAWLKGDPLAVQADDVHFPPLYGEVFDEGELRGRWRFQMAVTLVGGTPGQCKVHLVHESVSRFHCSLVRTPFGLWAIDLLSRKGVYLNGSASIANASMRATACKWGSIHSASVPSLPVSLE